jgi:hypothetical protein
MSTWDTLTFLAFGLPLTLLFGIGALRLWRCSRRKHASTVLRLAIGGAGFAALALAGEWISSSPLQKELGNAAR